MNKTWEPAVKWIGERQLPWRQENVKIPACPCRKCRYETNQCQRCIAFKRWIGGSLRILRRIFWLDEDGRRPE